MSQANHRAKVPRAELVTVHSAAALASLVRNHLSTLADWPILETFVDHILFPVENSGGHGAGGSIPAALIHEGSRMNDALLKETENLILAVTHQDEMITSLTQEVTETRACANAVTSCINEVFSQLDANVTTLRELETQHRCLQVTCCVYTRVSKCALI